MTKRRIVRRWLVVAPILACMACAVFQVEKRVGAPEGSYTPARLAVVVKGASEMLDGAAVTPEFFAAEKITPFLGRFFVDAEYGSVPQSVAVLSHRCWVDRFDSAPAVVGTAVQVDGKPRVIVGVAPPRFEPDRAGSLWIPKGN